MLLDNFWGLILPLFLYCFVCTLAGVFFVSALTDCCVWGCRFFGFRWWG